jgi:ribosomal protein S19
MTTEDKKHTRDNLKTKQNTVRKMCREMMLLPRYVEGKGGLIKHMQLNVGKLSLLS